ncbi:MAG: DEAD/DEAH box helicase family protein [Candidatus Methanoperedenaceae archaeon]|nr:DEAD/DEAH box helicase family protein [Candidatus Methanoperedenaceae archaeon]
MIQEIKTYKTADLVLQVSKNFNPTTLNLEAWDRYLDILCGDRQYQKEAIHKSIIFLASGLYNHIDDLVRENWTNPKMVELKNRYQTVEDYQHHLQMHGKLSASIDLATATGKSYVIYGIAQIMLGLGLVDRVLVLCPSLTIEDGLMEKFRKLAEDPTLLKAIPDESKFKNPSIKSADVTIKEGDICVENIHAVYEKTGSSIKDSFAGNGERTLVLNDEAHHIFNAIEGRDKESQSLKKWKEFLLSTDFNFKYIVGFTGTAYIKDDYFNDVIYRYSLRQAVNGNMVKMVDYVTENEDADDDIKFQEIYDNHQDNKNTYRKIKPLTILITKDIKKAKNLLTQLSEFIVTKEGLTPEEVEKKILIVTSANEHKANVKKLKDVDKPEDSTEWIVSVSMLTEGWDVKNVFQIVPWEDRAFNSKLLISQVLGRGLRIPSEYQTPQPRVRVFNHAAWSRNIRGLVDEILEIEMRLVSSPLAKGDRAKHHFKLHQIDYEKEAIEKEAEKKPHEFNYTKGFIKLQSQVEEIEKKADYISLANKISSKNTLIHYNTYTIDEIVNKILDELKLREWEGKILKLPTGSYSKENLPPKEEIKSIIRKSMDNVGILEDRLIEINKQKILSSFNTLLRKSGKTTVYERKAKNPFMIDTADVEKESIAVGNLRHYSSAFYSSNYATELDTEVREILDGVIEDETFPKSASKEINAFLFKTPLDLVFTKSEPERKFIEHLCKKENTQQIEAWMKSRDLGFYSIEYSITSVGGKHSKIQSFNPDFFIKLKRDDTVHFIILETKADDDINPENMAKLKYACQHFENLNGELKTRNIKEVYHFHILSPNSYLVFFDHLQDGRLLGNKFRSDLEDKLESEEIE